MPTPLPSPELLRSQPNRIPEAVESSLERIKQGSDLRAFITVMDERARASAKTVQSRLESNEKLPLAGWLLAVKDNIAIKDVRLTCASKILGNYKSTFTATAVSQLEDAGAIIVGKTNLDEFAMGSSGENSYFGHVKNPLDLTRVPGGSSAGSAVAVAADWVHGALGSETGGSVRQPASFCGIVGLKPTYGRVSRYGLVAFGSSLDIISPFAKSCKEAYSLFSIMSGVDSRDSTSAGEKIPIGELKPLEEKLRVGIPREYLEMSGISPHVVDSLRKAAKALEDEGHEMVEVSLPHSKFAIPIYYIVSTAEASSNLARFDGVRYGYRHPDSKSISEVYDLTRGDGFGPEVRRRIMMGTYVLSSGYADAYYKKAQRVRRLVCNDFVSAFKNVDVILAPTSPTGAFKIGEKVNDPLAMYLSDIFTIPASLSGIPSVSVPYGKDENGMPLGLQVMGKHFQEELILQVGERIESAWSRVA